MNKKEVINFLKEIESTLKYYGMNTIKIETQCLSNIISALENNDKEKLENELYKLINEMEGDE